jgi:predicted acetyltransferase
MDINVRPVTADEFERWNHVAEIPFGERATEHNIETDRRTLPVDRTLAAFDGDEMVGAAGAFPFTFGVPGTMLPTGGVTMVGVLPSHRRKGVLTKMMRHQLDDLHRRGESVAALWASESAIYPRFGYGLASWHGSIDMEKDRAAFVRDPGPSGLTRMIELKEAAKVIPGIHEAVAKERPGMFIRTGDWWDRRILSDPPERSRGWGPKWCVVWEDGGQAEAYAIYRTKNSWEDGFPSGKVQVSEALSTSTVGMREIWRYLFGLDLMARIEGYFMPVDHPLLHMLVQPDRLRFRLGAALWLRLVDVAAALEGRHYDSDGTVTIGLEDPFCDWNTATWRVVAEGGRASVTRTDATPDMRLTAVELGSIYLGGMSVLALARAGRIEGSDEALHAADHMFGWHTAPWCPEIF